MRRALPTTTFVLAMTVTFASGLLMPSPTWSVPRRCERLRVDAQDWADPPGNSRKSVFFRAATASHSVGQCGLEVMPLTRDGLQGETSGVKPRAILTGTLYVEPAYRRQGVAQTLLREAEAQARWWGVGEMLLMVKQNNQHALALYEKVGYKRLPQTRDHGMEVCMHKYLFAPTAHNLFGLLPKQKTIDMLE